MEKWRKENMPRKGQGGISEEGQELLEDRDIWTNRDNPPRSNPKIQKAGSCNIKKDQSHPHSRQTGSSGRERDDLFVCDLLSFKSFFMVQATSLYNLICILGDTCGLFRGT